MSECVYQDDVRFAYLPLGCCHFEKQHSGEFQLRFPVLHATEPTTATKGGRRVKHRGQGRQQRILMSNQARYWFTLPSTTTLIIAAARVDVVCHVRRSDRAHEMSCAQAPGPRHFFRPLWSKLIRWAPRCRVECESTAIGKAIRETDRSFERHEQALQRVSMRQR